MSRYIIPTRLAGADVVDAAHAGQPAGELRLPVDHDGIGHDDEVRAVVALLLHQVRDQCHDLHRLAQPLQRNGP